VLSTTMVRTTIKAALNTVPIGLWQRLFPKDVIAPFYHVVSDDDLPHIKYYKYKDTRQFEADVAYVRQYHRFVGYGEVVRRRLQNTRGPQNGFLFTFDDGFAECFGVIRPILLRYGAGAVFFVPTSFIDNRSIFFESKLSLCIGAAERQSPEQADELLSTLGIEAALYDSTRRPSIEMANHNFSRTRVRSTLSRAHRLVILYLLSLQQHEVERIDQVCEKLVVNAESYLLERKLYMTADQIRRLADDGFTIGGHGIAHSRLQGMSNAQIEREIVTSCEIIRELTGQKKVPFSFPFSGEGLHQEFLGDLLRRYYFIELFFDIGGLRKNAPYIVDRFWADWPGRSDSNKTNLPRLLRQEWANQGAWTR
jgi:peptidoglycan/xylan/chitin deacetylase (PgdA/CDA1 family)